MSGDIIFDDDANLNNVIIFNSGNVKELGRLTFSGGQLSFTGNVEESAEIFFNNLVKFNNQKIAELECSLGQAELDHKELEGLVSRPKREMYERIAELEAKCAKLQAQLEQTIKDSCDTSTKLFIANRRGTELQAEVEGWKARESNGNT